MALDNWFTRITKNFRDFNAPSVDQVAITPSDSVDIPGGPVRGLLLSADATVSLINGMGNTRTLPLQKGYNPIVAKRIRVTGTTLSGASIHGLR